MKEEGRSQLTVDSWQLTVFNYQLSVIICQLLVVRSQKGRLIFLIKFPFFISNLIGMQDIVRKKE